MLDHTYDPPVDEDVRRMRALIGARMRLLPAGFELPDDSVEVTPEERDALLEDFLSSPEGRRWRGDEDAEDAATLAIDFGSDYNHRGCRRGVPAAPLRDAVAAVAHCREGMLDAVTDPEAWGPAKTFPVAALDAGVDITDQAGVESSSSATTTAWRLGAAHRDVPSFRRKTRNAP